ncbi:MULTISPECIES: hypothetical protein [unclassified Variovorax]|uniref:hypothetical protein n=1 Tax=unclassified Variovorax TaxID=663243 RepID=UPI001315CEF8|nr:MULTISPECIES: hypothetical protein [unclassified Variovorax]VTU41543.1 hypothetical protein SRS16P1_00028 [Variovorax sp. SRS16]VTU41567.1 hypothetical protein E5P1_00028 [Variovorax sp. PBL-E5]VTU44797.1 hypothetical protein H6P1_00906 [Variovorax sp. PBL-H6]
MLLNIRKKTPEGLKAVRPPDKDFSLFVAKSKTADGAESVSEVLVPLRGSDDGSRGLFIRNPKEVVDASVRVEPALDVPFTDTKPTSSPGPAFEEPTKPAGLGLKLKAAAARKPVDETFEAEPPVVAEEARQPDAAPQAPAAPSERGADRTDSEVAQSAARTSLQARFANKKEPATVAAALPGATKKSFFGFGGKKAGGAKPPKASSSSEGGAPAKAERSAEKGDSAGKPAKPAKQPQAPRKVRQSRGAFHLVLAREDGTRACFHVSAQGLLDVPEGDVKEAASLTAQDVRFAVGPKTTYRQGSDLALSEGVGESVRIINAAKQLGAIYATSVERLEELSMRVGPGLLLVERAMVRREVPKGAHIVFILLEDAESGRKVAILYYRSVDGEFSAPQVTFNPTNLAFTLAQFQSARGLSPDSQTVQLSNADLVAQSGELQLYPAEAEWNGISVSSLLNGAVMVAAAAAIGTAGYAAVLKTGLASTKSSISFSQKKADAFDRKNQTLIASSLVSFGKSQSLDIARLSERAAAIWAPRSTLVVDATAARETYVVSMPLTTGGFVNNKPSALSELRNEEIQQLLKLTPPEECTKTMPGVSGGVNVIQVTVNCETPVGSAGRYRSD